MTGLNVVVGVTSTLGVSLTKKLLEAGYYVLGTYCSDGESLKNIRHLQCSIDKLSPSRLQLLELNVVTGEGMQKFSKVLMEESNITSLTYLPSLKVSLEPLRRLNGRDLISHFQVQVCGFHSVVTVFLQAVKRNITPSVVIPVLSRALSTECPPKGFGGYYVAKGALYHYCQLLEAEFNNKNIRVQYVYPEMFQSPLIASIPDFALQKILGKNSKGNDHLGEAASQIAEIIFGIEQISGAR